MFKGLWACGLMFLATLLVGVPRAHAMEIGGDSRLPSTVPTVYAASFFANCILNGSLTPGVAFHESDWWHDRLSDVTFDFSPSPTNPPVGFFTFNIAQIGPFAPGDQVMLYSTQNASTVAPRKITVTVTAADLAIGDATFQRNCVTTQEKRGPEAARVNQMVKEGGAEFHAWCSRCHGSSGRGNGPFAGQLEKQPVDLTQLAAKNDGTFPRELVRRLVDGRGMPRAHGTPEMPVWGDWFASQIASGGAAKTDDSEVQRQVNDRIDRIVAYLRALQRP